MAGMNLVTLSLPKGVYCVSFMDMSSFGRLRMTFGLPEAEALEANVVEAILSRWLRLSKPIDVGAILSRWLSEVEANGAGVILSRWLRLSKPTV